MKQFYTPRGLGSGDHTQKGRPQSLIGLLVTEKEGYELVSALMDEGKSKTHTPPPALEPKLLFLQRC